MEPPTTNQAIPKNNNRTNVLTKFHEEITPYPPDGHDIIKTNVLTKFHDDLTIILTFRENALPPGSHFHGDRKYMLTLVLTGKNAPSPGSHTNLLTNKNAGLLTRMIFDHIQYIIRTNVLTKFHEDVTFRVLTSFYYSHTRTDKRQSQSPYKEKCPPTGGHVFQATGTTFELVKNIIGTNLLTKFYDDRTMNMASRVLTRKNATPLGGHVFPPTGTIFELIQDIIGTNHLTKFHDDRTINVASRVLKRKNAPPPGGHVFLATETIFKLIQVIIRTNFLTKFHEDRKINVAYRVKNAPPPGSHVFQSTSIIFEVIQDIIRVNLLTKCHEDWTINVASREKCPAPWQPCFSSKLLTRKTAPPPGGHVFSPIWTIFDLVRDINETNVLTKFHDDWAKIVTSRVFTRKPAPPPGGHVFQRTGTIFELKQHIYWSSNVTSTVFTSLELSRGINGTNVLTKFHEDPTINVASRVFTRQNVDDARGMTHDGLKAITKAHHEHFGKDKAINVTSTFHADLTYNVASRVDMLSSDNHLVDGPTDRPT
ncbi:hypothetical protein DPMN_035392 [Dreissena polymorpha]|uniref:Uncharacterized protein n=1 Tax=Dreissena polymorpha TaxID=45954 RepID=A0A9D4RMV1_DREPO|nr:hypothetical protein DPMN_035392 [Dreissena polymorpha]